MRSEAPTSARPDTLVLFRCRPAAPWFIATDDAAAEPEPAAAWPARARPVRPPGSFKEWTQAKAAGIDLARWWREILAGVERPELFSWEELSTWRSGDFPEEPRIESGRRVKNVFESDS